MPKVLNEFQRDQEWVESIIKKYAGSQRKTLPQIAKSAGIPYSTLYKRIREPDKFQRGELRRLCKALKIPDAEKAMLL